MNGLGAPRGSPAPVDLADEAPFRIGRFEVHPSSRELVSASARLTLEPRVMQVLVVLARSPGAVVSRGQLIATCWAGRTVGQEALNRCIAVLRRPGDGPFARGFEIETIPRVGYRLRGEPETLIEVERAGPADRARRHRMLVALAALILGSGIAWLTWRSAAKPPRFELASIRTLVSSPAAEREPALSPSGRMVAYVAGNDVRARQILVQTLDGRPVARISFPDSDVSTPSWSADSRSVLYTVFRQREPCRFRVHALATGADREIGRCLSANRAAAIFSSEQTGLLTTERTDPTRPSRLFRVDLATGVRTALTAPEAGTFGDGSPVLSPDGRRVLLRRHISDGGAELVTHDLKSGHEIVAASDAFEPAAAAWLPDGSGVVFARREQSGSSLWTSAPAGRTPRRIALLFDELRTISSDAQGHYATEVDRSRQDVAWAPGNAADPPSFISPMNGRTYSPVFAGDGTLAFASDRGGVWGVWLAEPGRLARRIADRRIGETLRWSPTGDRLAFEAVGAKGSVLRILDRSGREGPATVLPFLSVSTVTWSADGDWLIFGARDGRGWRLYRVRPGHPDSRRALSPYGFWDVETAANAVYALRSDNSAIWRLDQRREIWREPAGTDLAGWRVIGDRLVWIDFARPQDRRLLSIPLAGGVVRVEALAPDMATFGQFDRDPHSGRFAYVREVSSDSDIMLFRLSRR